MSVVNATKNVLEFYNYFFYEAGDLRTREWFLIPSPIPGVFILMAYLYFVLNLGPKLMKNRKPFDLNYTLKVYNMLQVLLSLYIFNVGFQAYFVRDIVSFGCEPVDLSETPNNMFIANGFYLYFVSKVTELLDTIFFVLRKKDRQISFLHVYHHTCMCMLSWGGVKYFPGGHGIYLGFVNSFIHIIMYTYYFLATFGTRFEKYLSWKKYITVLQMVQFGLIVLHFSQLYFVNCGYPTWVGSSIIVPNTIFLFFLFRDFYKKSYKSTDIGTKKELNNNVMKAHNGKKVN